MRKPQPITATALRLPPRFLASVDYYRLAARYRHVSVDTGLRFDKRDKQVHRAVIADTHGMLRLTVPVAKPATQSSAATLWSDIRVSTHGAWWAPMWDSIASAYGRTPFFEFYADRFEPFFAARTPEECETITDLDMSLHRLICSILDIDAGDHPLSGDLPVIDCTRQGLPAMPPVRPYYQVRAAKLGFIPSLSVIDMIFNLGPESALAIRDI